MSRASISTGNITFNTNEKSGMEASPSENCHLVVLANFSGQQGASPDCADKSVISKRKIIAIDRDNFDEVFSSLNVQCKLPLTENALTFAALDDMHPDFLYQNLPLFEHFRTLKRKLKSSATFKEAAEEIYQWHEKQQTGQQNDLSEQAPTGSSAPQNRQSDTNNDSILDNLFAEQKHSVANDQFNIAGLIKEVIAPYVEPKPDPQQKELLKTVDKASSELMRKLMHHENFQSLESAWRSLYLLVKRIETSRSLKIFIVDITQQEMMKDALTSESLTDSQVYKLLVSNRESKGSVPFNLIMHDAIYGNNLVDINSLNNLSEVASACGAALVVGGSEKLAGCESLHNTPDKDDWHYQAPAEVLEAWNLFRQSATANRVIAVSPRYLARMPYGKKSSPIDSFQFEELTDHDRHRFYLWANGAWLVTLLAAQSFSEFGVIFSGRLQQVDQLPLHVYDDDGESTVTPCAEIHMTDSASLALRTVGLTTIRSIINQDSVIISNIEAIAINS